MAFAKWNTSGELTWADRDTLTHTDLNDSIDGVAPAIGTIVAWLKSFTGVPSTLPEGWVECNGQSLSDANSPLNGETIPDLNGSSADERFLRGNTTSGTASGSDSHTHTKSVAWDASSAGGASLMSPGDVTISGSNLPYYYSVVWIMRVK